MRETTKQKFSVASASLVWIGHIAIAIFFYFRGQYFGAYYWAAGFVFLISLLYLHAALTNKFIIYEARYIFLSGIIFTHTLCLFLPLAEIDFDPVSFAFVMKALFFGAVSFLFGNSIKGISGISGRLPIKNFIFEEKTLVKLPVIFYLSGWAVRILSSSMAAIQGWQIVNVFSTSSVYAGLMIDGYVNFSPASQIRKSKHTLRFIFVFLNELFRNFLTGMSGPTFLVIVLMLIIYIKAKKKIPFIAIILSLLFFAYFLIPFTKNYRLYSWSGKDLKESVQLAMIDYSRQKMDKENERIGIYRISWPMEMAIIAYQKKYVEGIQIKTFESPIDYISRFIPRFLWPSKPIFEFNRVGKEFGLLSPDDENTSVGFTLFADFIMQGGMFGVILGMFFIGVIMRLYWDWLMVRTQESIFAFILYFDLIRGWMGEQEFYVCLHGNVSVIFYCYFLLRFLKRKSPRVP